MVALLLAVLVLAAGVCLTDATGHHGDGPAQCCAALLALAALTAPLALGGAGRLAPLAVGGLPALALDPSAPPPEA